MTRSPPLFTGTARRVLRVLFSAACGVESFTTIARRIGFTTDSLTRRLHDQNAPTADKLIRFGRCLFATVIWRRETGVLVKQVAGRAGYAESADLHRACEALLGFRFNAIPDDLGRLGTQEFCEIVTKRWLAKELSNTQPLTAPPTRLSVDDR
ncbi:MAG: hypothetical protein FJ202_10825 [Gemmatimonadetes bacterium]|nr:hypothetical protein [Gemmatimonadota bacterium]